MNFATMHDSPLLLSGPPAGSVNVRTGKPVEGPGGRWVPCATASFNGMYIAGLFEVGPGCKQVCAASRPMHCVDEALALAIQLAATASA
jgi:hypothetical protein